MMCLLIAAKQGRKAMKIDIGEAYLNAEMSGEEVILEIDRTLTNIVTKYLPDVIPYIENITVGQALYGCVQSAKLWYEKLTTVLKDMGFVPNHVDPCVLNKIIDRNQCTLAVFVDDIQVLSVLTKPLDWVLGEF